MKETHKTEASNVGAPTEETYKKELTPEQKQIAQIAESCATVFELMSRSVPSNHLPTVKAEAKKMEEILKFYGPVKTGHA